MRSRYFFAASGLFLLLVISSCQPNGSEPTMQPVETATQQIVVEPSQTVFVTASIEPTHTATLKLELEDIPTATSTTAPAISPLLFAPENVDDI